MPDAVIQPVIQIDKLVKTLSSAWRRTQVFAVKNVSLTVKAASVVAFVGRTERGKTTTIHSLLGFLKSTAGPFASSDSPWFCGFAPASRLSVRNFSHLSVLHGNTGASLLRPVVRHVERGVAAAISKTARALGLGDAQHRKASGFFERA